MKSVYFYMTSDEKEFWRKNNGAKFDTFQKKMEKKYYGPIYKAFDDLPKEIKDDIKETVEVGRRIAECMYEMGDAYVSDLRKLSDNCHSLKGLVDKDKRE
tara:strand:+ start:478 stop:777 length:300 start_codon:yes stop_codon:yes gene_type:complete